MSIYYGKIKVSGGAGNSNNTWSGTKAEYNALGTWSDNIYYYVTDDDNDRLSSDNEPVGVNVEQVITEGTKIASITVGDDTTDLFIPDCASYVIESWHDDNGNWYRIYSDGWCEQGGTFAAMLNTSGSAVQLYKPFINTNYKVQVSSTDPGTAETAYTLMNIKTKNTNSFIIYGAHNSGGTDVDQIDWEAKGFIK